MIIGTKTPITIPATLPPASPAKYQYFFFLINERLLYAFCILFKEDLKFYKKAIKPKVPSGEIEIIPSTDNFNGYISFSK